ncbi:MAG: sn-glycerol-3-phosphate ABC transporter ATP-binding protein UgpC [Actinomycetota bacterium]|nr:sn-glycerol-3-phosphate ABC transporter ATP-binding protein UgpC [Actinomycetota bacterium]
MATVTMEKLTKVYPNGQKVVQGLDLSIREGEFVVLVGPSGCGKTTTLRMVAGLEEISDGTLMIGDRIVNDLTARDRDIAMVFQNYALYPHMTVAQNIGFALTLRKKSKEEVARSVANAAEVLGLMEQLEKKPGQLSGGQRQRVAMGRAIVRDPSVFLMDEPLSNLDANLRVKMRAEVSRVQRQLGVATLYVTHDQVEAMTMGDRVAVMHAGDLQQCADPQTIYSKPANLFVASFIGSPSMNIFEAGLSEDGSYINLGGQRVELASYTNANLDRYRGKKVAVGFRPEHLSVATSQSYSNIKVAVDLVEALGSELLVYFRFNAKAIKVAGAIAEDEDMTDIEFGANKGGGSGVGVARIPPNYHFQTGQEIDLTLNSEKTLFFDIATGEAI